MGIMWHHASMDEEIRKAIIEAFVDSPTRSQGSLLPEVAKKVGREQPDVYRTVRYMEDAGELLPEGGTGYRLTLSAALTQAPTPAKVKKYLAHNWLALTALLISAIALLK